MSESAAITHGVQACYDNGESWNLVCDCQWEAWEQPDEETARRLHARHVADEGSPAANRQECGCKAVCGDLREKDDNPRAVCKGLPVRMGVPNRG